MNSERTITSSAKPILKWAGGKRALLPQILKHVPKRFNTYFEPFFGGGAVFFAINPPEAILSDLNPDLIITYRQIRNNLSPLIAHLSRMKHEYNEYYLVRANTPDTHLERAARFIYLNRTCWNGLYRVNRLGKFNVPMGRYLNPKICDHINLHAASKRLQNARLITSDFSKVLESAEPGDFIYLDPPYVTSHNNNGFVEYNSKIFALEDQVRLATTMQELSKRGCMVLMSNANHKAIRQIYAEFYQRKVVRQSIIAGTIKDRGRISELLISNYALI
jgi:DNA adenine methylase